MVSAHHDVSGAVARAAVIAEAANRARDLQNAPANVMTPTALAEHALALDGVSVQVEGPSQIAGRGMGAFAAVARGSYEEPRLITIAHDPPDFAGPHLVLVGKAVTFDSGGISIKPGAKMADMKFDMSGGAAVIEAVGAIARLGLPLRVTGVVGATENMPSGRSMRPSDVVTAMNGTTIEIINTDCEGRLVLADCLAHAVALGAERIVDIATLTGRDGEHVRQHLRGRARRRRRVGRRGASRPASARASWSGGCRCTTSTPSSSRAPPATSSTSTSRARPAGSRPRSSSQHFTGGVPWAHVDMAGTAYGLGRAYAPKEGSGWGVRLLVDLATRIAGDA